MERAQVIVHRGNRVLMVQHRLEVVGKTPRNLRMPLGVNCRKSVRFAAAQAADRAGPRHCAGCRIAGHSCFYG